MSNGRAWDMETNSLLADDILAAENRSKYDASCKRILSEKILLAHIMRSCLKEYRDTDVKEIAEKYITGEPVISQVPVNPSSRIHAAANEDNSENALITYDIRFYATAPKSGGSIQLIINLEAQNDFYPGYPLLMRAIYYCCRQISSQYGVDFEKSHYEKLIKVYSIWICFDPPENRRNSITKYSMFEEQMVGNCHEDPDKYDLISAVMICLGGPNDENYNGILKLLDVIFSEENSYEEKKDILQNEFNIPMTEHFENEVAEMCNLSKGVEERGLRKGIQQGIRENKIQNLISLMRNMNWTAEEAMEKLDIPKPERSFYHKILEQTR